MTRAAVRFILIALVDSSVSPTVRGVPYDGQRSTARRQSQLKWLLATLILTNILFLSLIFWASVHFGSIRAALDYVRGARVIVDANTQTFGSAHAGSVVFVPFKISNLSGRELTLLGAHSSCSCLIADGFPMTLADTRTQVFRVQVRTKSREGPFAETLFLFTDDKSRPRLALNVTGTVTAANEAESSQAADKVVPNGSSATPR